MWTSKTCLLLGGLLLAAPAFLGAASRSAGASGVSPFLKDQDRHERGVDRNEMRDEASETQPLLDALARETRRLDKAAKDPLLQSLDQDYGLGLYKSESRRLLEHQEAALDLEDQARVERAKHDAATGGPERRASAERLDGLERERLAQAKDLLRILMDQQKKMRPEQIRDYRTWLMVSEGRLRQRREAAEAASPKASPVALSAQGLTPPASALAPPAKRKRKAAKPRPTPAPSPAASPAAAKP